MTSIRAVNVAFVVIIREIWGKAMNHDYYHCLDYLPNCPKECFRAQLTEDLRSRKDLIGILLTWTYFYGTDECVMEMENNEASRRK